MERIFEIIKRHDLTEEEFSACLDAIFKKEIAEDYKTSYKGYKKSPYSFNIHELKNKFFFERLERNYPSIFGEKNKERDNSFYFFLLHTLLSSCFIGDDYYRSSFINHSSAGGVDEIIQSYYRHNNIMTLYKQRIPSVNLSSTLKDYLNIFQEKKITPTIEAFKKHQDYCILLQKLAEYNWETIEKIEDDFKYLMAFLYSLKLYVFSSVEVDFFLNKKKSNAMLPDLTKHDHHNRFVRDAHRLNEDKERILSIFHPNDETVEEFVVRCADYFGIKAEGEVKPAADKQTQVKEKQITQVFSEVLKPKMEEPKAE